MKEVIFYGYFRSSCSYRVRIALHLKNIPFIYRPISLIKGAQKEAEFLKINPMGQVPCLVIDNQALTQSLPIIQYLDEKYSKPALFPKDLLKRTRVLELCEVINSFTQPLLNSTVLKEVEKLGGDKKLWLEKWMLDSFKILEKILSTQSETYSFGSEIQAFDLFLIPQLYNARRFKLDLKMFPNLLKVEKNCLKLPSFEKSLPENQKDSF